MKFFFANFTPKTRIVCLFCYVILACIFVYLIRPNYITNLLLVYLPPSLITFFWLKKTRRKVLIFSVVTTFLFALPIELVARLANAWDVASIFPRLFSVAPLENLFYAFINFFWVLAFYEYFVDNDKNKNISKKWKYLIGLYCLLSVTVYALYNYAIQYISLNYWVIGALVLFLPALLIFGENRHLLKKIIIPTLFFAGVFCLHEIVSLLIGHWWWPGSYLLPIKIQGIIFPLDDVIIWYFLSTPALIGGYEFFMDDYK